MATKICRDCGHHQYSFEDDHVTKELCTAISIDKNVVTGEITYVSCHTARGNNQCGYEAILFKPKKSWLLRLLGVS